MHMKRMIRFAFLICLAALLLTAGGCAGSSDPGRQAARINQTVITESDLDTYTALKVYRAGYDPSGPEMEQRKECLEETVNAEVVRQYYEANGTEIYDDLYNAGKEAFLAEMQSTEGEFLDQNNISYDQLVYFYRAQFVTDKFFEETRAQHNEEEIAGEAWEYYQAHLEDYTVEKEKRISMILLKKKKQAEEIIRRLDSGEDFAVVAREASIDENSAARGGDLGFFKKQETRDRFGKGVFRMTTGEYTETPVKTNDGYAVFKITDSHDSGYLTFEESEQDIVYSLYVDYNNRRIREIRESMDVETEAI